MRIVCLSDTHCFGPRIAVPDGDLLLHAGDHTFHGTELETRRALDWLASLPHRHKVFIAGNHDFYFDRSAPPSFHYRRSWSLERATPVDTLLNEYPTLTYLEDSATIVNGYAIYGAPWTPWFHSWAFNFPQYDADVAARATWAKIPNGTNILLTHTPPDGILDRACIYPDDTRHGDPYLRNVLDRRHSLRLHVFGHIHEQYGRKDVIAHDGRTRTFVNAALNTRRYEPTNRPIVVDLPDLPSATVPVTQKEAV